MRIVGKLKIVEHEGGFELSAVIIDTGDQEISFSEWLCRVLGGNCDTGGRCGVPDQEFEGQYAITVERID